MISNYRSFFGMAREAFPQDLALKDILETQDISQIKERLDYVLAIGAIGLITGEVGSGKSTEIRYILSKLHPSEYQVISITACSGSILEFDRLLLAELNIDKHRSSRAAMIRLVQREIKELVLAKKRKVLLVVDEASMLDSRYPASSTPLPSSTMTHGLGPRSCLWEGPILQTNSTIPHPDHWHPESSQRPILNP